MTHWQRLFSPAHAFDHPVTLIITIVLVVVLALSPVAIRLLARQGRITDAHRQALWLRWRSWLIMTPLLVGPILLGAAPTILGVGLISLMCYREYSRATGLFREKVISFTI